MDSRYPKLSKWQKRKLVTQEWCNMKEMVQLTEISREKAAIYRDDIRDRMRKKGYYIPNKKIVPMEEVIKYFHLEDLLSKEKRRTKSR